MKREEGSSGKTLRAKCFKCNMGRCNVEMTAKAAKMQANKQY